MKVTREYIEQCIIDGAEGVMGLDIQHLSVVNVNLGNGFYLNISFRHEEKNENEIYLIPAMSVHLNLRKGKSKVGDTIHIRTKHDAELASYYFAGLLNITD